MPRGQVGHVDDETLDDGPDDDHEEQSRCYLNGVGRRVPRATPSVVHFRQQLMVELADAGCER